MNVREWKGPGGVKYTVSVEQSQNVTMSGELPPLGQGWVQFIDKEQVLRTVPSNRYAGMMIDQLSDDEIEEAFRNAAAEGARPFEGG